MDTQQEPKIKIRARKLSFFYEGGHQALFDNDLDIPERQITAVIGPSGCGKSTHLRTYNRIYSLHRGQRAEGEVLLDGENILDPKTDLLTLRRRVGMIFQKPTSPIPCACTSSSAARRSRSASRPPSRAPPSGTK